MKIALIMPPMDSGNTKQTSFRKIYNFARGASIINKTAKLVMNLSSKIKTTIYPYGLVQLATILTKKHDVKIFNFLLDETSIKEIIKFHPDLIGITCSTGGNLIWIDEFSRHMKNRLNPIIVFGGPHVTSDPILSLKTTVADYILTGESDFIFYELLEFLEGRNKKIPNKGICYIKNKQIINTPLAIIKDLDKIPTPDHTILNLKKYSTITLELSRGCTRKCPFCYLSGYDPKLTWRPFSISKKINELKQIQDISNLSNHLINLVDLNSAVDNKRMQTFCKNILKNNLKTNMFTDIDTFVDYPTLRMMKSAGFSFLQIGVESGSKNLINHFQKYQNNKAIKFVFKKIKKAGIVPIGSLVLMNPNESKKDLKETLKLCYSLTKIPIHNSSFGAKMMMYPHLFVPYPNTYDYKNLIERGWKPPNSFKDWGVFYEEISEGNFNRYNFTKNITKLDLKINLLELGLLNLKEYLIPHGLHLLNNKFSK